MATNNTPDELREAAARCRAMAKGATVPELRANLVGLAETFDDLALQVEWLTNDGHWPPRADSTSETERAPPKRG